GGAAQVGGTEPGGPEGSGSPGTARLPRRGVRGTSELQLWEGGKPVPAQFDRHGQQVDFNVSLGPFEHRDYTVTLVERRPPDNRDAVREDGDAFVVSYTPSLQFVVPRNLLGLLRSVKTPKSDYLKPHSQGLLLRYRDDIIYRAGGAGPDGVPTASSAIKQGPLSTVLEFRSTEALRSSRSVESRVRMEFPRSKSWVKTTWTVEDPDALVIGLGADVSLNAEADPVMTDFGVGTWIYAALRPGARGGAAKPASATLLADPQSWRVLLGNEPYGDGKSGTAEGWAHVMDRERATAAA